MNRLSAKICFLLAAALAVLTGCSSSGSGGGVGACVSSPVDYGSFVSQYCYDNYTSDECSDRDAQQVNGASWTFYSGQSCADRGLSEGSNYL